MQPYVQVNTSIHAMHILSVFNESEYHKTCLQDAIRIVILRADKDTTAPHKYWPQCGGD